jgi:aarF domain-containing kinase
LKVQFPGVAETIDSDLAILERALRGFLAVARKEIDVAPLIEELAELLRQEVDYELEATNLVRYAEGLRHCGGDQDYVLPVPVAGYVTKKVLGMSFEEGVRIPDWLRTRPSQEERDRVGRQILDLYHAEFFDMGLVQTDPNFSNFLLRPKEGRLVLLDFGAVKSYSDDFRRDYRSLLKVMRHGSDRELLDCALAMDLVHPEESAECLECFVRMLRMSIEPFNPSRQPFVFADADYSKEVRVATLAFTSKVRLSPPPRKILFLHRKLGGVFSLLKSVEARLDLTPYWQRLD